ncbi:MAG: superoxide dismutase [Defluviitaleaceae bacterium]|nr:superoxide dismutase [Defluviitaleaceae bacterium]
MNYPFSLTPLPYKADSLEPYIDTETMNIHHGKHVQAYVDNLNSAIKDYSDYHSWSLEKLLYNLDNLPEAIRAAVRNNGGGVFNHDLFFSIMVKEGKGLQTGSSLSIAIEKKFGSLENLQAELKQAGLTQFGSGWAWLVSDREGNLQVLKTPNQDALIGQNLIPIINLDVWEHAYYLLRQNRRPEYIDNFFKVVNWEAAEANYAKHTGLDYSKM